MVAAELREVASMVELTEKQISFVYFFFFFVSSLSLSLLPSSYLFVVFVVSHSDAKRALNLWEWDRPTTYSYISSNIGETRPMA